MSSPVNTSYIMDPELVPFQQSGNLDGREVTPQQDDHFDGVDELFGATVEDTPAPVQAAKTTEVKKASTLKKVLAIASIVAGVAMAALGIFVAFAMNPLLGIAGIAGGAFVTYSGIKAIREINLVPNE